MKNSQRKSGVCELFKLSSIPGGDGKRLKDLGKLIANLRRGITYFLTVTLDDT